MCHDTIGSDPVDIQSQPNQNHGTWWDPRWEHLGASTMVFTFDMMEKFGFLEKGIDRTQVFVSQLLDRSRRMLWNMSWERISPLKIYNNFKTWNKIVIFVVVVVGVELEHCDINLDTYENSF